VSLVESSGTVTSSITSSIAQFECPCKRSDQPGIPLHWRPMQDTFATRLLEGNHEPCQQGAKDGQHVDPRWGRARCQENSVDEGKRKLCEEQWRSKGLEKRVLRTWLNPQKETTKKKRGKWCSGCVATLYEEKWQSPRGQLPWKLPKKSRNLNSLATMRLGTLVFGRIVWCSYVINHFLNYPIKQSQFESPCKCVDAHTR